MKMVSGSNFFSNMPTDSSGVLINETAARLLGYSDPINKPLYRGSGPDRHAVSFRMRTNNIPALIAAKRERYRSLDKSTGQPFVYSFMDDDFNKQYETDRRTGRIFISFSVFAIFIACLGLFGLVT
jgi:putative ABC transport system permease protein